MVLKPDYQTFASLFKSNGGKKVEIVLLHQILQPKTLALRSNDLCFYTSDGAFIWKDSKLYANRPFVVWLEFILLWYIIYGAAKGCENYNAIFV